MIHCEANLVLRCCNIKWHIVTTSGMTTSFHLLSIFDDLFMGLSMSNKVDFFYMNMFSTGPTRVMVRIMMLGPRQNKRMAWLGGIR